MKILIYIVLITASVFADGPVVFAPNPGWQANPPPLPAPTTNTQVHRIGFGIRSNGICPNCHSTNVILTGYSLLEGLIDHNTGKTTIDRFYFKCRTCGEKWRKN